MKLVLVMAVTCCLLKRIKSLNCHQCEDEECDLEDLVQFECPDAKGYACFEGSVAGNRTKSCLDKKYCKQIGVNFSSNVDIVDVGNVKVAGICCVKNLCNSQIIVRSGSVAWKLHGGINIFKILILFVRSIFMFK